MNRQAVLAERMRRQGLIEKAADEAAYRSLFRALQPVPPVYFSMPGSAPRLRHRTDFDDAEMAESLRAGRELVKGRFCGGFVAYVLAEDLELYGTAFRTPLREFDDVAESVLQTLRATGPLSTRQLRLELNMTHKRLMPVLHRLQRAFLVFEDQEDGSWERPWCLFEAEWPDVDLERRSWDQAAGEVLRRLLAVLVWATESQLHAWARWHKRQLRNLLVDMEQAGEISEVAVEGWGGRGWMLSSDDVPEAAPGDLPSSVFMMHRADPLVRPYGAELKARYADREILQYLLIDGELSGAVCGHWRIKAHDVDDIATGLTPDEARGRQEEVLAEVRRGYGPPGSQVVRYEGMRIDSVLTLTEHHD